MKRTRHKRPSLRRWKARLRLGKWVPQNAIENTPGFTDFLDRIDNDDLRAGYGDNSYFIRLVRK